MVAHLRDLTSKNRSVGPNGKYLIVLDVRGCSVLADPRVRRLMGEHTGVQVEAGCEKRLDKGEV